MNSKLFFQMNEMDTISSKIAEKFDENPKAVYIFSGTFKESGFNILEDNLIDSKFKKYIVIGIDKKNTTKIMLDSLLSYTNDVYIFNNNEIVEFDASLYIFEFQDRAVMYNSSSNVSESGLINNFSLFLETVYDLKNKEEKKQYKEMLKALISKIEGVNSGFTKLTSDMVKQLQEDKEIFTTKQYIHNVKSISELIGKEPIIKHEKNEVTKDVIDDIYISNIEIPKIEISDADLALDDIDISQIDEEPIALKENVDIQNPVYKKKVEPEELDNKDGKYLEERIDNESDLYDEELEGIEFDENETLDISNMLFSKAELKLDIDNAKKSEDKIEKKEDDELVKVKKLNLNNISNFIYELPSRSKSAKNQDSIRIPNYISKMIPKFFELSDNSKTIEQDNGVYKVRNINLEIVDVKTGEKYTDREAKILYKVGQSYVQIISDSFKNINYNELDIARIIKLDSKVYHIEIISSGMQEYKLWSKLCAQQFKSSKRRYGMM